MKPFQLQLFWLPSVAKLCAASKVSIYMQKFVPHPHVCLDPLAMFFPSPTDHSPRSLDYGAI